MTKVAVILSGCGVFDGSEIHEACAALLALDRAGAEAVVCAPSGPQMHVVNHLAGQPEEEETRDILIESARLARGNIIPLAEMDSTAVDAALLPGGFGAAKNLCNFASEGASGTVHPEVSQFLRGIQSQGKPLGAMCIAPVILAKIFGAELSPHLTIGNDPTTAGMIQEMGAIHMDCPVSESIVDKANLMVTTPAYMLATSIQEVFEGAEVFVSKLLELCPR